MPVVLQPKLSVSNAQKHGDGFKDSYIDYEISSNFTVLTRRRFQDFVNLSYQLKSKFFSILIPPLPKAKISEFNDRFSSFFIKKRLAALNRFINRIHLNHKLIADKELDLFLKAEVYHILNTHISSNVLSLENIFGHLKFGNKLNSPAFFPFLEYLNQLKNSLNEIVKILSCHLFNSRKCLEGGQSSHRQEEILRNTIFSSFNNNISGKITTKHTKEIANYPKTNDNASIIPESYKERMQFDVHDPFDEYINMIDLIEGILIEQSDKNASITSAQENIEYFFEILNFEIEGTMNIFLKEIFKTHLH